MMVKNSVIFYASCAFATAGVAYICHKKFRKGSKSKLEKSDQLNCHNSYQNSEQMEYKDSDHLSYEILAQKLLSAINMKLEARGTIIHMKDKSMVVNKMKTILESGLDKLQIISDFDRTMSRFKYNGQTVPTCHGIMESDPELGERIRNNMTELKEHYYQIEIDPHMADSEKIPYMLEWWGKSHEAIVQSRLHQSVLNKLVDEAGVVLREGVETFLRRLDQLKVPCLIFSAGIGNIIEELLVHFNSCYDNVKVVSNFMNFDAEGTIVGFQGSLIHIFNKSAKSIQDSSFYEDKCLHRTSVLLLGDSSGDVKMADGIRADSTVLRVGFLNDKVESNLARYMDLYDIVLIEDDTFNIANILLDFMS